MPELYIPTLHTFAMDNTFTGSCGNFRFKIEPQVVKATPKEVDFEKSCMKVFFWHGLFCFEKSEIEGEMEFPMTEDGRLRMKSWLEGNI